MEDKAFQLLTTLAAKLGTTTEYLWAVLLKQAVLQGVLDLISVAILVAVAVAALRITHLKTFSKDQGAPPQWEGEIAVFACMISAGIVILTVVLLVTQLSPSVSAIVNPDFWALKYVVKALGK